MASLETNLSDLARRIALEVKSKAQAIHPSNIVSGLNAVVTGGVNNSATGGRSSVNGGIANTASGLYSVAEGYGAVASQAGQRAYGSQFVTPGDAQDFDVILKREVSNGSPAVLFTAATEFLTVPVNTTWAIDGIVTARRIDAAAGSVAWRIGAVMTRNSGTGGLLEPGMTITDLGRSSGHTWSIDMTLDTASRVNILCTGEAGKVIRWVASLRIVQVSS